MIGRLAKIGGVLVALLLWLVFAIGTAFGAFSRVLGAAVASGWRRGAATREAVPSGGVRRGMKLGVVLTLVGLAVGGAILGALVVVSGIAPITASSGHWPITEWFLHFAMRRSIATHSLGTKAPALDKPDVILKGATHYEIGCRSCHGSPGLPQPRIPQMMTPHPPYLPSRVGDWKARELFYVVKHGVKFTGMPAWPALKRDDEVWAVVAFLQTMPGLDQAKYERLIHGEPPPVPPIETLGGTPQIPASVTQSCARCHGDDGLGRGTSVFPKLAGQHAEYAENALAAYAAGQRHSGIMEPIAAALDAEEIRQLAAYYQALPPVRPSTGSGENAEAIARGETIVRQGLFEKRIPACAECHSPGGRRHKPAYPTLAGQPADYLVLQLELFKKRHRGGSAYAHLMHPIADRLDPEQMRAVALYLESLSPVAAPREP